MSLVGIKNREGKNLFAVCYELYRFNARKRMYLLWKADIVYLHADDANHAKHQFYTAYPNRRTHKVVAIAPPVGYYVNDNHGEDLSL